MKVSGLIKVKKRITFDIVIPTPKGAIYCAYLCHQGSEVAATSQVQKKIGVNIAHDFFGHDNESSARENAEALGFEVTWGTLKPCKACAAAKAKQKNLPTHGEHILSKENNERIFLDLSTVKAPKDLKMTVTKPNWKILADERTQLIFSDFYEARMTWLNQLVRSFING